MLVLTRRENERIELQGGITVTVLSISGGQCKIGIDAPRDLKIRRGELPAEPSEHEYEAMPRSL